MGGQACVLYGAAEFSRDTDLVILADHANLRRLRAALRRLQAEPIAVPRLELRYLRKGHAVHFRCRHPEAAGIRVDIMAVLRGVPSFQTLWRRRTIVETDSGDTLEVMALPDLVRAKKTQRDKDWPMLRRLIEADYAQKRHDPTERQVDFWLSEARTPALLLELASKYESRARRLLRRRSLLRLALNQCETELANALSDEETREREADRAYWMPLREELERLRRRESARRRSQ